MTRPTLQQQNTVGLQCDSHNVIQFHVNLDSSFFIRAGLRRSSLKSSADKYFCLFVCFVHRLLTPASTPREWIFVCTTVFTPASRAANLRLRGGFTCMLRICLYRMAAILLPGNHMQGCRSRRNGGISRILIENHVLRLCPKGLSTYRCSSMKV